ncbi:MAG: ACT domain-containing protein [Lysobacteraceae bacterium]
MSAPTGETDLSRLLAGLAPELAPTPRAIRTQAHDAPVPADAILLFREDEGTTVIVATDDREAAPLWAQVTLRIHSSLDAVGMMAAISAALTDAGIPCNAISAYYHDHLFVPWARREDAMDALHALVARSRA